MFNIGRVCMKIAGRDSNKYCVVIEQVDAKTVIVDGETRRKKVNIKHLMPLKKILDIKKNASHEAVEKELSKILK